MKCSKAKRRAEVAKGNCPICHVVFVVADSWCLWPCHRPRQLGLEAVVVTVGRRWGGGMYVPDGVDDARATAGLPRRCRGR